MNEQFFNSVTNCKLFSSSIYMYLFYKNDDRIEYFVEEEKDNKIIFVDLPLP